MGFNEALNGFTDEGWSLIGNDGMDDVSILVNSSTDKLLALNLSYANGFPAFSNAVLCAKASMLLQNVPPAVLLRFLREYMSEWADNNIDAYFAASSKVGPCSLPGDRVGGFGNQVILPLAHTIEHEELLEVIKLEGIAQYPEEELMPRDMFLLQLCCALDENAVGTYAELIFAPIDASFAGLLSIAEETLTEFLSKATGTAVEFVQMPGMKPGPDSIGIVAISHGCVGVAARACSLVGLEPTRIAEILKDRPFWLRDCRAEVLNPILTMNKKTCGTCATCDIVLFSEIVEIFIAKEILGYL